MKKQQCAYCSLEIPTGDVYVYNSSIYHQKCGERVRLRTENPAKFRILDSLRNKVELLYSNDNLVVNNIDEIEDMERSLSKLISTP